MIRKRAVVLGCGYVGRTLARALVREGADVIATTRSPERFREIESLGAHAALAEVMEPSSLAPLLEWEPDVVFDLVRPQRVGPDRYTVRGTRNVAEAFDRAPLAASLRAEGVI